MACDGVFAIAGNRGGISLKVGKSLVDLSRLKLKLKEFRGLRGLSLGGSRTCFRGFSAGFWELLERFFKADWGRG